MPLVQEGIITLYGTTVDTLNLC